MKTIAFLFCTIFCVTNTFATNNDFSTNMTEPVTEICEDYNDDEICEDEKDIIITITLDFGKPKKGCRGFGICLFIEVGSSKDQLSSNDANATLTKTRDGRVLLEIDKNSMTKETYNTYLSNGVLRMDESYTIPQDLSRKLGFKSYTIEKGQYNLAPSFSEKDGKTMLKTVL